MRFIVDESTGAAVVEFLRSHGHDVLAVAEGTHPADDLSILALASSERRILITNDKDFGELVYRSGQAHHGVLLLRLHEEGSANRVRVVKSVLDHHSDRLPGRFVVASEGNLRIRSAP